MKTDKEIILAIKDGEERHLNMSEGGGALVAFGGESYWLYEIPMYGGEQRLIGTYKKDQIDEMIAEYRSWT